MADHHRSMVLLFTIFMRVLVTLFTVGIVGSAVVVSITFVEDFQELFHRRDEHAPSSPHVPK
jgi:hypothetical protein